MASALDRGIRTFANLYPVWTVVVAVLAMVWPGAFTWFQGPWILWSLALVMLSMGLTLSMRDFRQVMRMPGTVALGFVLQYTVMPLLGWVLAKGLALEPAFAVGLIVVACCPGGIASNLFTYLAGGHLALSVCMTMVSTLLAFVMTPLLTSALAGHYVPVDAWSMCKSVVQMVLAPVLVGVAINRVFPRGAATVSRFSPIISVCAFLLLTGGIVGASAHLVKQHFGILLLAAALLHTLGFLSGFAIARLLRYPVTFARTIAIEVGMQNCGLATVLTKTNFPNLPLASVSTVFCAFLQTLVGSAFVAWWRLRPPGEGDTLKEHRFAKPSTLGKE